MQYTKAEELVLKHFKAEHKRRWYVWFVVGVVNFALNEVLGHYFEFPERAILNLHPFRITTDEPRFERNSQDKIAHNLIVALRASHQSDFDEFPDAEWTKKVTEKANSVKAEYLTIFPLPEED